MKPGHIELFVSDSIEAKDFYVDVLGFEVVAEQAGSLIWVKMDTLELLLRPARNPARGATYQDAASGIVLYTETLEETAAELRERGLEFKGTDGSDKCLTFTDPDGNWFQLVNPNDH